MAVGIPGVLYIQLRRDQGNLRSVSCDVLHRGFAAAFPEESVVKLFSKIGPLRNVRICWLHLKPPNPVFERLRGVVRPRNRMV